MTNTDKASEEAVLKASLSLCRVQSLHILPGHMHRRHIIMPSMHALCWLAVSRALSSAPTPQAAVSPRAILSFQCHLTALLWHYERSFLAVTEWMQWGRR